MSPARKRLVLALKTLLAAVVVVFVGIYFHKLLNDPALEGKLTVRWEYLVPAGFLYLACHTLWATFWWQLLRGQGAGVSWLAGVRAYFVSQPGKYVPGKALVILLRVGLLRNTAASRTVVIVTGTYETLTNMAAGAMVGALLLPWCAPQGEYAALQQWAVIGLAFVPLVLLALNKVARRIAAKYRKPDAPPLPVPSIWLLARGMAQSVVGWVLLGVSAWLVSCGLSANPPELTPLSFARHLSAVCISYVIGFVALFLPGGVGAREAVLQSLLTPALESGGTAAAVAVVLRIVWTAFELLAVAGLWGMVPRRQPDSAAPETSRDREGADTPTQVPA